MRFFTIIIFVLISSIYVFSQSKHFEFNPNGIYDSSIPTLENELGFSIGDKPINYYETVQYLKSISDKSPIL